MALTPEGTPYVEASDLVAAYPAASLSLANRVDLVGVLPFADAAARNSAITSPTDGQYVYLQDTNATQFYNGSSWIAATPGITHINTTAFTTQSAVNINDCFSSTYDNYKIIINAVNSTSSFLNARLRVAGADNTTANYRFQVLTAANTVISGAASTGQTAWGYGGSAGEVAADWTLLNPFATKVTKIIVNHIDGTSVTRTALLAFDLTTSFTGFTIYPNTGTFTGSVSIYGLQQS
jgi:hypothetical protein